MVRLVQFRLLGPLEVIVDREFLEIRSARQRIVLCVLLLQANQVVPLCRIIDAVWAKSPPATAKSQIQTCISALRRLLARAEADCSIATRSVGYAIRIPDHSLDVQEFEDLVTRGRAATEAHRTEDAVLDLRAALAMWRGPAAGGIESDLVQAAATRLNENRISVLEECIELELALGRHYDLTGELSELVKRYPLRERLRAQHMLALYRSARQAEALESFREARQVLTNELGLDPGEELRALERAVLAKDRVLDLSQSQQARLGSNLAAENAAVIPRQLAATSADFTGREDLQKSLIAVLSVAERDGSRHVPVVVLTGKGGVGKTALALQIAHAVRQDYPGGQLFARLRETDGQPIGSMELQSQFLRALGFSAAALPSSQVERTAIYRSVLGERRILIVLDDADSAHQLTSLIPGCPNSAVIITSRHPLATLYGAHHFEVDDLDERTSIALLARIIGAERVAAEQSAARELVRLCDGLPLALRIAGTKLAVRKHWRIEQLVARMASEQRRLDELTLGGTGIRATLTLSYESLDKAARQLFMRLGLLGAADFASWVSAPLLDMDVQAAADVLDSLVETRLVEVHVHQDGLPRFRLRDLVRIYALERLTDSEPRAERDLALRRLLGCWLWLAAEARWRSYGGDFAILHGDAARYALPADMVDQLLASPLSWFRAERAGLVSAVVQAAQAGFDELCWDLAVTSVTLFESEHLVDDWRRTHEIALEATCRAGSLRGQAALFYSLATMVVGDQLTEAARYLDPALRIFEEIGDPHGHALASATQAFIDRLAGRLDQALARYTDALAVFRMVGDRVSEAGALGDIALVQLDLGRSDVAEELLDQALAISHSLKAPRIAAQTECKIGELLLRKGHLHRAERSFQLALQLVADSRDRVGEACALQGLGTVHTRQKQYALAEADLRAALGVSERVGDRLMHGQVLLALAEFHLAKNEPEPASSVIAEALVVFSLFGPAPIWRARLLALQARRDELVGGGATATAARRATIKLAGDCDPPQLGALVKLAKRRAWHATPTSHIGVQAA